MGACHSADPTIEKPRDLKITIVNDQYIHRFIDLNTLQSNSLYKRRRQVLKKKAKNTKKDSTTNISLEVTQCSVPSLGNVQPEMTKRCLPASAMDFAVTRSSFSVYQGQGGVSDPTIDTLPSKIIVH